MGPDARRREHRRCRSIVVERQHSSWPHDAATRRATRGYGASTSVLVVGDGSASPPPPASYSHRKTLSRDHLDFNHGLLGQAVPIACSRSDDDERVPVKLTLRPLPERFYLRSAEIVAQELLGHLLVRRLGDESLVVRIIETEAYLGEGDRASHAWRGRPTERTRVLFGAGGIAYVYLVYGLHNMLNVVTGDEGDGCAVLIRSGEPMRGKQTMVENRGLSGGLGAGAVAGGPGKLCQALSVGREFNGVGLEAGELRICSGESLLSESIAVGSRIGVDYAGEAAGWPLRFAESGNRHVSRPYPW